MFKQPSCRKHGFSLVEIIAALGIFSVGVMAVMEVFTVSLRSTSGTLGHTQAVYLAQKIAEEMAAEGEIEEGSMGGVFGAAFPRHSWECHIEETSQTGLYQMDVTVLWEERGRPRKLSLTTLIAPRTEE